MVQLVECLLAKEKVTGSSPVARSENQITATWPSWQGKGLQNPHHEFESRRRLSSLRWFSFPIITKNNPEMKPIVIPTSMLCSLGWPCHTDPTANERDQANTDRNTQSSPPVFLAFPVNNIFISEYCNIPTTKPLRTIANAVGKNWKYSPPVFKVFG